MAMKFTVGKYTHDSERKSGILYYRHAIQGIVFACSLEIDGIVNDLIEDFTERKSEIDDTSCKIALKLVIEYDLGISLFDLGEYIHKGNKKLIDFEKRLVEEASLFIKNKYFKDCLNYTKDYINKRKDLFDDKSGVLIDNSLSNMHEMIAMMILVSENLATDFILLGKISFFNKSINGGRIFATPTSASVHEQVITLFKTLNEIKASKDYIILTDRIGEQQADILLYTLHFMVCSILKMPIKCSVYLEKDKITKWINNKKRTLKEANLTEDDNIEKVKYFYESIAKYIVNIGFTEQINTETLLDILKLYFAKTNQKDKSVDNNFLNQTVRELNDWIKPLRLGKFVEGKKGRQKDAIKIHKISSKWAELISEKSKNNNDDEDKDKDVKKEPFKFPWETERDLKDKKRAFMFENADYLSRKINEAKIYYNDK